MNARARRIVAGFALAFLTICNASLAAGPAVPPVPHTYVTDNAGALSAQTRDQLENELRAYEKATGHQVIVWIGQTTGDVPLEDWTSQAAHAWGIGRKGKDDGAVLFLFMTDHRVRIEVGYGLEGSLPDAKASEIVRNVVVPHMRSGDTNAAVRGGVAGMLTTITPNFAPNVPAGDVAAGQESASQSSDESHSLSPWAFVAVFGVLFMIWISIALIARSSRRHGGGGWIASSGGSWNFGSGDSDFGGGGFSAGGGGFGGGGASGSW